MTTSTIPLITAARPLPPLVSKVKVGDFTGTIEFGDTTSKIVIGGREFFFDNKERVYDIQQYLMNELH